MHTSVVMPLLQSAEVSNEAKRRIAELVVQEHQLIAGNFSEPVTTSLIGERPLKARVRRVDGGYRLTGRKMFASMLEAADFVLVMAYPEEATSPWAGIILLLPREAGGRRVDPNWDVLGMRATRSDSLILDESWLPESAAIYACLRIMARTNAGIASGCCWPAPTFPPATANTATRSRRAAASARRWVSPNYTEGLMKLRLHLLAEQLQ
jgi:alkylation response protein AidB-like acyl-CoA dehydrogenase